MKCKMLCLFVVIIIADLHKKKEKKNNLQVVSYLRVL